MRRYSKKSVSHPRISCLHVSNNEYAQYWDQLGGHNVLSWYRHGCSHDRATLQVHVLSDSSKWTIWHRYNLWNIINLRAKNRKPAWGLCRISHLRSLGGAIDTTLSPKPELWWHGRSDLALPFAKSRMRDARDERFDTTPITKSHIWAAWEERFVITPLT